MPARTAPPFAATALAVTIQDWNVLSMNPDDSATYAASEIETVLERVTALMLVRIVAVVVQPGTFQDVATSTICRSVMMKGHTEWPDPINPQVISQLQEFVRRILMGYKDVPYHNYEHAYHVVVSMNKLIDLMLTNQTSKSNSMTTGTPPPGGKGAAAAKKTMKAPTYGLRHDPLMLLALLFSALVHDVEHQGIPNRQLAVEDDRLAVLYNDQSIAEHWSLYVAFSEFLQDEFQELRNCIFYADQLQQQQSPDTGGPPGANREQYRRFRRAVINLVLCTDIASPERTQIGKSKWKEAFGDPFETVERKLRSRRHSLTGKDVQVVADQQHRANLVNRHSKERRGTGESVMSQLSIDVPVQERGNDEMDDDDDSLSGTPDNSVHGEDDVISSKITAKQADGKPPITNAGGDSSESAMEKFERRLSANSRKYRYRLGILRAVDLSGETLETYSRASIGHSIHSFSSGGGAAPSSVDIDLDEPDELKATVVMEVLMTAADVAHNLQGWDHMIKWSGRLYMELRKAYHAKRGSDPQNRWFENQTGFLESYLLPLARRLDDTGVFGAIVGPVFVQIVESNRDRWLTEGYDVTQTMIEEGQRQFPIEGEEPVS